ncbi:MAG TPA: ATP-binding protein [Pyrinomonadaceae bacterium]|nr:ATP-binding protein [Pyrinomonadaceae bacterium]
MRIAHFSLDNLSIKHRLPLLIGTLLLGSILASTIVSYRGAKESVLEVGGERLQGLTGQLALLLQQSSAPMTTKTLATANEPVIRAFLQSPSPTRKSEAGALLKQFTPDEDPNAVQVELWDTKNSLLLTVPSGFSAEPADLSAEIKTCNTEPYKAIGPMRLSDNMIKYPVVAATRDESGNPIGYLVRWRRTSLNPPPKQLMDLLGSEAALYFGNIRGDLLTNLDHVVPNPAPRLGSTSDVMHYSRDGRTVMGLGRPITGTPWFVLVEFPEQQFLAQTNRFLRRILVIDIILFSIGMAGAFALSRSITRPLNLLTKSAAEIGGGDFSKKIYVRRNDELGVLGDAFNSMTGKVRDSQTELERKVEALGESEHRLQTVIENLSEGLVVADLSGQLLNWNRAALEIHGFATLEEGLLELPDFAKIFKLSDLNGSVLELNDWPLARIIRGEQLRNLEVCIHRIDSDWQRVFNYGGSIVREASGRQIAIVTMSDITHRKRAEQGLQSSETRYRRLFESAKDGILILNADTGKILDVNPYLIAMLHFPKGELVGKRLWELGPFKDIVASKLAFAELQERGYVRYENLPLETREGVIRQVEFVSNAYRAGEKDVLQCNIRDITERKLAEERLQQTNFHLQQTLAKLQAKSGELKLMTQQLWQASKLATMGELAASVAHELNNPLATVSLKLESLADQQAADSEQSRSIQIMAGEVERMGKLVGSLLEFSRRGHQQVSTIAIGEEIAKSVELIEYYLRSRRIDVIQDFEADLPTLQADRQQLRQVFLNLLTNASDAMPEGGRLIVRAKNARAENGVNGVEIEFADAGMGIPPSDLENIWDPFFTTKPEGKGTGLGLAICRRVIEEHHGRISIESRPDEGTTVTIFLPATGEEGELLDREH